MEITMKDDFVFSLPDDDQEQPAAQKKADTVGGIPVSGLARRGEKPAPEPARAARYEPKGQRPSGKPVKKKKKKVKHRGRIKALIWILSILILSAGLTGGIVFTAHEVLGFGKDEEVSVVIPPNSSTQDIARILKQENAIKVEWMFRLFSRLKKADSSYKYGTYSFNANAGYDGVIEKLQSEGSHADIIRLTIREGATLDDMMTLFEQNGICSKSDFKTAMKEYSNAQFKFLNSIKVDSVYYRLEGYLFPDTYQFTQVEAWNDELRDEVDAALTKAAESSAGSSSKGSSSGSTSSAPAGLSTDLKNKITQFYADHRKDSVANAKNVLQKMLGNFNKKFNDEMVEKTGQLSGLLGLKEPMDISKVITMASIIEAEAGGRGEDSNKVAAVFYNRLNWTAEPPKLGSDPTMTYAKRTGNQHYNTRDLPGLPPGPICSPSLSSIQAALNPTPEWDYDYFLTDTDMVFYYSKTYTEHTRKKNDLVKAGKWAG